MKTLPLVALLIAGCSVFSSTATPEAKIADANLALTMAKEIGPKYVADGTIQQAELDAVVALLDAAVKSYDASLRVDDVAARAAAREAMLVATVKLLAMLAD